MKNNLVFISMLCFLVASMYSCRSKELIAYKKGTNYSHIGLPSSFLIKSNNVIFLKDTLMKLNFIEEQVQIKMFEVKAIFWNIIGEWVTEVKRFSAIDTIFCLKEMNLELYKKIIKYVLVNNNKQLIKSADKMLLRIVSEEDDTRIYHLLDNNMFSFGYPWRPDQGVISFKYLGFEINMGGDIRYNTEIDTTDMDFDELTIELAKLKDLTDEEAIIWLEKELERTSW